MLFRSVIFHLHECGWFSVIFLRLISSLSSECSEYKHCMISNILHFLRCILWFRMWSILVNVPCELKKNVQSYLIDIAHLVLGHHNKEKIA